MRRVFLFVGLALLVLTSAVPQGGASARSTRTTFTGILSIMWGGALRAELTLPDGTTHPLKLNGKQHGLAQQFSGKRVEIRGRMTGGSPATIVVDSIAPAAPRGK
jgi:hypothetical protein